MSDGELIMKYGNMLRIAGVSMTRINDLAQRAKYDRLTSSEKLAFAVLKGGNNGESATQGLIDAAQEEWGEGHYRIPVRIVTDKKKCKVLYYTPRILSPLEDKQVKDVFSNWLKDPNYQFVILTIPGTKVEVYEFQDGNNSVSSYNNQVEIREIK